MNIRVTRQVSILTVLLSAGTIAAAQRGTPQANRPDNPQSLAHIDAAKKIAGDDAFLNLKSREAGHTRQEFDYPIPVADAHALLALCLGGLVAKHRHYVRHGGHLWEVDEFEGDNAGLVVAEIELQDADEAFDRPDWLGAEVTESTRYYNLALATCPYSQWSAAERTGQAI